MAGVRPALVSRHLAVDSLQWAVGMFCAFIGAFVLVSPHQFDGLPFAGFAHLLPWWGLAALVTGVALLSVPVTRPGPALTFALHSAAGVTLLVLGVGFGRSGAWLGLIVYSVLGLGTAAGGLLPGARQPTPRPRGDLLALLIGLAGTVGGLIILLGRNRLDGRFYESSWDLLPYLAALLLLTASPLAWLQLRPPRRLHTLWAAHVLAGAAFVSFGLVVSLPGRVWTGVALYCGGGVTLALLPWARRRLVGADPAALRTRLALALALATSVALILAVAVVGEQEERLTAQQVIAMQQTEAASVAQNVADYLQYNSARAEAVAAAAAVRRPQELATFLADARHVHPDVVAFAILDRPGRVLAREGRLYLGPDAAQRLARSVEREGRSLLVLLPEGIGRHLLLLGTPIRDPLGTLRGVLVTAVDSRSLQIRLLRAGSRVLVADGNGTVVASLDRTERRGGGPAPVLPPGWDATVVEGGAPQVEGRLAAFAVVPGAGWAVAVERPRETALAGVRRGRDLAFLLLLGVVAVAVLVGIATARRIARPLGTLADAVDQMAAGNPAAPLAASTVSEVSRLSRAFATMRDRLAQRTAEAERLARESQNRAEELAERDRRKDEFLAMLAHELRNPLGAIANASYLLEQIGSPEPRAERARGVIQRQIRHLVRLVDDLLDVSRITHGKVTLHREPVEMAELVRLAAQGVRPLAEAKGNRLTVSLPAEPLPLVADPTRLEQVLSNLLRNSVKFTGPGGSIAVIARREGEEAVLCVRDDGIGIAPELLPHIFDLFTQGEQTLDRSGAGLGIGLTLVKHLVQLHGGRVEAHSDGLGRGAELVVRLPLAPSGRMAALQA